MKHSPFWWEIEQGLWQASGEVNLPLEADYVIVGAGYTGLSAAKFCAEEQIECDLQMTGRFTGAMSSKDYENQCREADRLNTIDGHKAFMVQKSDQQSEIKTD